MIILFIEPSEPLVPLKCCLICSLFIFIFKKRSAFTLQRNKNSVAPCIECHGWIVLLWAVIWEHKPRSTSRGISYKFLAMIATTCRSGKSTHISAAQVGIKCMRFVFGDSKDARSTVMPNPVMPPILAPACFFLNFLMFLAYFFPLVLSSLASFFCLLVLCFHFWTSII